MNNAAYGASTLGNITTGDFNTAFGSQAYAINGGSYNTAIGGWAGYEASGDSNVFIGFRAGHNETGGDKLVICSAGTILRSDRRLIYGNFSTGDLTL